LKGDNFKSNLVDKLYLLGVVLLHHVNGMEKQLKRVCKLKEDECALSNLMWLDLLFKNDYGVTILLFLLFLYYW